MTNPTTSSDLDLHAATLPVVQPGMWGPRTPSLKKPLPGRGSAFVERSSNVVAEIQARKWAERLWALGGPTFAEAAEPFFEEVVKVKRSPQSVKNVRSLLRFHVLPAVGDQPIRSMHKSDVKGLLRHIGSTRKYQYGSWTGECQGRANSVHWLLKAIFKSAADENLGALLDVNPCIGLPMPYAYGERDRWFSADEIRWFWAATGEEGYPCGDAARLLLLTGQRRSEIGNLMTHHVDRAERTLRIPIWIDKSRRGHIVPISSLAMTILEGLPRQPGCPYLFSCYGTKPVSSSTFVDANRRIAARMVELKRAEMAAVGGDPHEGIEPWVYHDLRRTAATVMAALGHPLHVVDKVLNHAGGQTGTGRTVTAVTRIYAKHEYLPERRETLEALGQYVKALASDG